MESEPVWNDTAEDVMQRHGQATDPNQLRTYDEQIKIVEAQNADGKTVLIPIDGESPAQGPYVSKPFNPNHN